MLINNMQGEKDLCIKQIVVYRDGKIGQWGRSILANASNHVDSVAKNLRPHWPNFPSLQTTIYKGEFMSKVELLSPAGDMECLISAVQNGANAVYFGAQEFNARANSKNFGKEELAKAIKYAKLRNVKTHLTLNILIKNNEFEDALKLVEYAYNCGIDSIIVQDLGLAKKIIELFPGLEVHASTQMTIYSLDGVKKIEELGFNRCVLARELSIPEIEYICKNTNIDIEVFIHGALCICYSGQCLMSSMIGGRSGNRGKCARNM